MASPKVDISRLSPSERLELLEALWDSLDPNEAAPITPELTAELERRSAEAAADPEAGRDWDQIKADLKRRLSE
jgi:putative addiction module component (TIGR02574 family)